MAENTMRAARFHEYGPPEVLVVEEVPRPEPGEGEVLIRVHAAGVNPIDWKFRAGYLQNYAPLQLPNIPGFDLAGTVEALGPGVTDYTVGEAVFGRGSGAYAEYAVAPVVNLAPKPGSLTFDQAGSISIGALTAWSSLFIEGKLEPGQHVLVHAAAGGVGSYAVQFAHWKGAHVAGTASGKNVDFVRSLGAETVVDYTTTPFEDVVHDVDLVVDNIGGETQARSWATLKRGGMLVAVVGLSPEATGEAEERGIRTANVAIPSDTRDILKQITDLIASGDVKPEVGQVFSLDDASKAHAVSESMHGRGRIVLHIAD